MNKTVHNNNHQDLLMSDNVDRIILTDGRVFMVQEVTSINNKEKTVRFIPHKGKAKVVFLVDIKKVHITD